MLPPRTILVPVDFGPTSERALAEAVSLARTFGAELHVFHAFALPPAGVGDFALRLSDTASSQIVAEAKREVSRMTSKYDDGKIALRIVLEEGDPSKTILTCAGRIGADLIVMGTHAREGLARVLIGSTTEAVIRTSPVPVLTVRGQ